MSLNKFSKIITRNHKFSGKRESEENVRICAQVNWENTTAALARGQAGHLMVKELDPDAPHR